MAGVGWQDQHDELDATRVLEYTEPVVKGRFVQDGRINAEQLVGIPAVFAQESGTEDHLVRFGEITRAKTVDKPGRRGPVRVVEFDYVVDPDSPTITSSDSAAKIGAFVRTAIAIESDGRASIVIASPATVTINSAKYVFWCTFVI